MTAVIGPSSTRPIALSSPPPSPISPKGRERPLPAIPTRSSRTTLPQAPSPSPSAVVAGKRKAVDHSLVTPYEAIRRLLTHPRTLSHFLSHLPWCTFHALISTCQTFRRIFSNPKLRNAILAHYVPGYRFCSGDRDDADLPIDISLLDLADFNSSQSVPLHHYPMHALRIIASPRYVPSIPPTDPVTLRLVDLAQAHTRIVLLLHSLVHSDYHFTLYPDLEDVSPWKPPALMGKTPAGFRELVFPKPLSFFDPGKGDRPKANTQVTPGNAHKRASTGDHARRWSYSSHTLPRVSTDFQSVMSKKSRASNRISNPVKSVFGRGPKVPLPPPSSTPPASNYYVAAWRRTLVSRRPGYSTTAVSEDEDDILPRPRFHQRRASSLNQSTESSLTSSTPSSSRSNNTHTDYTTDASSASPREVSKTRPSALAALRTNASSPHDLSLATSRLRAPLLRVFVPCTHLDEVAITACEEQLIASGAWEHLSAGDIICNFGFVPPPEPDNGSHSSKSSIKAADRERTQHRRRWLMFNGYCLVHYIPPSPPPVENSLILPSPFYFSHILPPFSDPRFILALPPLPLQIFSNNGGVQSRFGLDDAYPQLTLSHVRTRVASPHSPGGHAYVKKYMWLMRIPYVGPGSGTSAGPALGEGWQGEWMLEAEGTKEGRQSLVDAVKAGHDGSTPQGLWDIVRDKSGGGRIWMRLITLHTDTHWEGPPLNGGAVP